jgi:acetolactate synthase small subunit
MAEIFQPPSVDEPAEQPQWKQRVVVVEYQKWQGCGRSPTGVEAAVFAKLTSRGYRVISIGTIEGKDAARSRLTLVIEVDSDQRFRNALAQIQGIIPVIEVKEKGPLDAFQHLTARVRNITPEEMDNLQSMGKVDQSVSFVTSKREKRRPAREMLKCGARITNRSEKPVGAEHFSVKLRLRNMSESVRCCIAELRGTISPRVKVTLTADVQHVQKLAEYLRGFRDRLLSLDVSAVWASLDDRKWPAWEEEEE